MGSGVCQAHHVIVKRRRPPIRDTILETDMKKSALTRTQQQVMLWISQGWSARVSSGSAVEINGKRVCTVSTMEVLERKGLVERESRAPYWVATTEGRKLSPGYAPAETN